MAIPLPLRIRFITVCIPSERYTRPGEMLCFLQVSFSVLSSMEPSRPVIMVLPCNSEGEIYSIVLLGSRGDMRTHWLSPIRLQQSRGGQSFIRLWGGSLSSARSMEPSLSPAR